MSIEKAKAHYRGSGGRGRLNCAQAVAEAFGDVYALPNDLIKSMASCGTGRAPEGECGALFAAKTALRDAHPDKVAACETAFAARAGSTRCKEIRKLRLLPCLGCVETAASFLADARHPPAQEQAANSACPSCASASGGNAGISLERQVRMFAGGMVVIGSLLAWFVHPAFAALPVMIGCGLVYAGATDNCFATMLLSNLPWNKGA